MRACLSVFGFVIFIFGYWLEMLPVAATVITRGTAPAQVPPSVKELATALPLGLKRIMLKALVRVSVLANAGRTSCGFGSAAVLASHRLSLSLSIHTTHPTLQSVPAAQSVPAVLRRQTRTRLLRFIASLRAWFKSLINCSDAEEKRVLFMKVLNDGAAKAAKTAAITSVIMSSIIVNPLCLLDMASLFPVCMHRMLVEQVRKCHL